MLTYRVKDVGMDKLRSKKFEVTSWKLQFTDMSAKQWSLFYSTKAKMTISKRYHTC